MYCLYLLSFLVIKTKHIIGKLLMFFCTHIFTPFNNFVSASMSMKIFHLDLVHIRKNKTNILLTFSRRRRTLVLRSEFTLSAGGELQSSPRSRGSLRACINGQREGTALNKSRKHLSLKCIASLCFLTVCR